MVASEAVARQVVRLFAAAGADFEVAAACLEVGVDVKVICTPPCIIIVKICRTANEIHVYRAA